MITQARSFASLHVVSVMKFEGNNVGQERKERLYFEQPSSRQVQYTIKYVDRSIKYLMEHIDYINSI